MIAKVGISEFTTFTKALLYPSTLSSKINITNHHNCTIGLGGLPLLESLDELDGERKEMSFGNSIFDGEYPQKVNII
jgi:hypothetical protein